MNHTTMAVEPVDSWVTDFHRLGWAVDRGAVTPGELSEVRRAAEELYASELALGSGRTSMYADRPWKINDLHSPGRDPLPRALALLTVHPRVVRGAQRILGPRVCLAASSMTFKHPSGGPPVPRHRDTFINKLPGPQQHIVLNIDICIDVATVETGCLWMASGTHQLLDVEEIAARDPDDWSDMVPVEGQPGDIVFHNDLTVHGSPATAPHDGSKWRRIALSVYVDPDGLHQHGFVSGMSGVPAWDVLALMDLMQDIVNLRQTVHGDVDYVIPPWTPPAGSPTEPPEQPPLLPCGTCVD